MSGVAELFATATMALEDLHLLAVEGQWRDLTPDRARALIGHLRIGLVALETILAEIVARLP